MEVDGSGVAIPGLAPIPVVVEELIPGAPADAPFSEMTANWIWPLLGSTTRSWTWPRLSPVWLFKLVFISLLKRTGSPARVAEELDGVP